MKRTSRHNLPEPSFLGPGHDCQLTVLVTGLSEPMPMLERDVFVAQFYELLLLALTLSRRV
jgi:hypothetical protein